MEFYLLLLLLVILLFVPGGRGCVTGLPTYQSYTTDRIAGDRVQAIVPSYRFTCPGRITGWGGCFSPSGSNDRYYVVYQVWRERVPGCYQLVGPTSPPEPHSSNLLRLQGGCNKTALSVEDQIQVERGDVVGFYVDYWRSLARLALFNPNNTVAGFQVVSGRTDVEVFHNRGSTRGTHSGYAVGSLSPFECYTALPQFSDWFSLYQSSTGAPVITVRFEPAVMTKTQDPGPDVRKSDQQMQLSTSTTIIFSGHPHSSPGSVADTLPQTSTSTSRSSTSTQQPPASELVHSTHQPPASELVHSTPTSSSLSHSQLSQEPPLINATPSPALTSGDRHASMAVTASLLVLLNILLITGASLLIILCVYRRCKKQKDEKSGHTISGPHITAEPVPSRAPRQSGASGDSQSVNRSSDDAAIAMVSNLLYGLSPARGSGANNIYSEGMGGEGKGNSRLTLDSMVYNGLYAHVNNGKMCVSPRSTTSAVVQSPRNVRSTTDSDGYEYIGHI